MQKMIGCDFDKTIYNGNSSIDFFRFCAKNNSGLYRYYPKHIWCYILYLVGRKTWTETVRSFFTFMKKIDDPDKVIEEFWNEYDENIKDWFFDLDIDNVIVLTDTSEFLMEHLAKKLGFNYYIGTAVDKDTGAVYGESNSGIRKLTSFKEQFPDAELVEFYSDSKKDLPLAEFSSKAYKVKKNKIKPWPVKQ